MTELSTEQRKALATEVMGWVFITGENRSVRMYDDHFAKNGAQNYSGGSYDVSDFIHLSDYNPAANDPQFRELLEKLNRFQIICVNSAMAKLVENDRFEFYGVGGAKWFLKHKYDVCLAIFEIVRNGE